jgi:hypothetical protein
VITKRDPSRKRYNHTSNNIQSTESSNTNNTLANGIRTLASQALASAPVPTSDIEEMQIDPSLLQAANDPSFAPSIPQHSGHSYGYVDPLLGSTILPTPVYLRISPQSQIHAASRTWVEKLTSRTIAELRRLVAAKFPGSAVSRIEGIEKDESGSDVSFLIDEDHELDAYLTHVQGRKASFILYLNLMQ